MKWVWLIIVVVIAGVVLWQLGIFGHFKEEVSYNSYRVLFHYPNGTLPLKPDGSFTCMKGMYDGNDENMNILRMGKDFTLIDLFVEEGDEWLAIERFQDYFNFCYNRDFEYWKRPISLYLEIINTTTTTTTLPTTYDYDYTTNLNNGKLVIEQKEIDDKSVIFEVLQTKKNAVASGISFHIFYDGETNNWRNDDLNLQCEGYFTEVVGNILPPSIPYYYRDEYIVEWDWIAYQVFQNETITEHEFYTDEYSDCLWTHHFDDSWCGHLEMYDYKTERILDNPLMLEYGKPILCNLTFKNGVPSPTIIHAIDTFPSDRWYWKAYDVDKNNLGLQIDDEGKILIREIEK